ncbi:MAG: mannose-6-phosphate isomerase, class I [Actinomycetaceae bacterium]|nr:mannose-6-phosphate isomerase, class I [Actinomycetaceae bacterium]
MVNSGVYPIKGYPQFYTWGHQRSIPDFLGEAPTGQPFAELWFGTHELGQSVTDAGMPLKDVVARTSGGRNGLPFLLKYIAPAKPLSLQVHPSQTHAERGFLAENAQGIALDAPERCFRDSNHKPELLYALKPWRALVGFAPAAQVIPFFHAVGGPLAQRLGNLLASFRIDEYMRYVLTDMETSELVDFISRCEKLSDHSDARVRQRADLAALLNRHFPRSAGVMVAMVMNDVTLQPGQAIFVPVGTIHAYVSGFGVEVMTCSDNVVRAGLTEKYIDIEELFSCSLFEASTPQILAPQVKQSSGATLWSFRPPVEEFQVDVAQLHGRELTIHARPHLLATCIGGQVRVEDIQLERGRTVFIEGANSTKVDGSGTLLFVTRRGEFLTD